MNTKFSTLGLVARAGDTMIAETVRRLVDYLRRQDVTLWLEQGTAQRLDEPALGHTLEAIVDQVQLMVVVGGDGSLLGVARTLAGRGVPVVGVNRGGLGFLADIHPGKVEEGMAAILAGQYLEEKHFMLEAIVERANQVVHTSLALNDVVIHAGTLSRMMEMELNINAEFVCSLKSEGVIIATPTGSTAYGLSAGGPILHPLLDAIEVVPMFAHALTARPIAVSGDSAIEVVVAESHAMPKVSCDSQVDFVLQPGDRVRVEKKHSLLLLHLEGHTFFAACRDKLGWASKLHEVLR